MWLCKTYSYVNGFRVQFSLRDQLIIITVVAFVVLGLRLAPMWIVASMTWATPFAVVTLLVPPLKWLKPNLIIETSAVSRSRNTVPDDSPQPMLRRNNRMQP